MKINEDVVKGKWLEIRGEIQKVWGKITSDELEETKGDAKAIAGLVRQKYGKEADEFQEQYDSIVSSLEKKRDSSVNTIKSNLKK